MIIDWAFKVKSSLPVADCNFYSKGSRYELVKKMADYYENAGNTFRHMTYELLRHESATPVIIETVMNSIGIMQRRITRINLAVASPDIHIQPHLGELKMMNFDHVEHAIEEGHVEALEKIQDIRTLLASDEMGHFFSKNLEAFV